MTAVPADLISVVIYLSVFCIVGTVGNGLVVYVIMYVKEPIVSRHFIITLAVLDIIACVVVMPMTSYYEFLDHAVNSDIMCKVYHFLITSNVPFSVFIMVAIAIERCSAICQPLWRSPPPGPIIILLTAFSLLLGTVVALFFGTVQPAHPAVSEYVSHWMRNLSLEADDVTQVSDLGHVTLASVDELRRLAAVNLTWVVWVGDRLYVNSGRCLNTDMLISNTVQWYFHKCYACLYVISLILIFIFYSLIFHSVLERTRRRQHHKVKAAKPSSKSCSPLSQRHSAVCLMTGHDTLTEFNDLEMKHYQGQGQGQGHQGHGQAGRRDSRRHMKRQKTMSAEVKSAAMLFVITMVFTISYMPAFFMSLDIIPYNRPVFYMYFLNFAINPIIYGFMNQRFRSRLNLFCRPSSAKAATRR
jgi:cholecystokinin A receptor